MPKCSLTRAQKERLERACNMLEETFDHILIVGITDNGCSGAQASVKAEGLPLLQKATEKALVEIEQYFKT